MKRALLCCVFLVMAGTAAYCGDEDQGGVQQEENVLPPGPELHSEMARVEQKIAGDPEIMQIVASLMFDPEFQELMKDPEIVAAVQTQNVQALMRNEKFLTLMNNPKLREINDKVHRSSP